jgi:hypothetical protein
VDFDYVLFWRFLLTVGRSLFSSLSLQYYSQLYTQLILNVFSERKCRSKRFGGPNFFFRRVKKSISVGPKDQKFFPGTIF